VSQIKPVITSGDDLGKPFIQKENSIRRLFVETGFGYKEIANSSPNTDDNGKLVFPRIVETYIPPSPSFNFSELKIANAPSRIHGTGKSSYLIGLRLIFPDKVSYSEFLFFSANNFKFYDERGGIYSGLIQDSITPSRIEAGHRYDVKINLIAVKKDIDDRLENMKFVDLDVGYAMYEINITNASTLGGEILFKYYHNDYGVIDIPVTIGAYENQDTTMNNVVRALRVNLRFYFDWEVELGSGTSFLVRLKSKRDDSINSTNYLTASTSTPNITANITLKSGKHWAIDFIRNAAHAGLVAVLDFNGNYVYTFEPNRSCKRSEGIVFINRFRKYIERLIR
jgi:hypothetical protein